VSLQHSRRLFAVLVALVFALATALVVLLAYLVADLYLSNKGWLVDLPDGRQLAHLRMRNLLLLVGLPLMTVIGFAVGWYGHAPAAADSRAAADAIDTATRVDAAAGTPAASPGSADESR